MIPAAQRGPGPPLRRLLWPLVGFVAVVLFLVAVVFPTRSLVNQRGEMAAEKAKLAVLTDQNGKLASRVGVLHTDAEIERLAREQYNLVRPGEEAYAILPSPAEAAPDPLAAEAQPAPPHPWWSRAWDAASFWD